MLTRVLLARTRARPVSTASACRRGIQVCCRHANFCYYKFSVTEAMTQGAAMSEFHITREYPHSVNKLWHALTDPELVALWTSTGRGGRPEGFSAEVGNHFRFVGKAVPGWNGIVDCEVREVDPPFKLRHT